MMSEVQLDHESGIPACAQVGNIGMKFQGFSKMTSDVRD